MTDKIHNAAPVSQATLIRNVIDQIQVIIEEAESAVRPLEMEPYRGRLFELFVVANGAGLIDDDLDASLTSDEITRVLGDRWQLRETAAQMFQQQVNPASGNLSRMRLLWAFLRMWMEWTYAWERWPEFHDGSEPVAPPSGE